MTTGKTIALTRQTFVGKVMSLLLNMLSRLVITFLPRGKHLLISWLQSPSAVILEPPQKKKISLTVSTVSPSISHEVILVLVVSKYPMIERLAKWSQSLRLLKTCFKLAFQHYHSMCFRPQFLWLHITEAKFKVVIKTIIVDHIDKKFQRFF